MDELKRFALEIRIETLNMLSRHGFGHVGGSLSIADALAVLYGKQMRYDPKNPKWEGRDYLVLSKGHCGPALYSALAIKGFFPREELLTINKLGTRLPSHTDKNLTPGIDMTTGSLGQGVSCALGMALGLKVQGKPNLVYAIIGDGEAQEGQVWETMLIAPNKGLDNFIVLLDNNRQQLDGFTNDISSLGDVCKKAEAFGWFVVDVDGHDVAAIDQAIEECKRSDKPGFINLNTIKGKGWPAKEAVLGNHALRGAAFEGVDEALADLRRQLEEMQ
ncbi:MAG TPA: transketolase [Thermoclostridium sp.]|nr:transketolase [Clostridiaceae bacterium]HOQ75456.1 transketolase [Thermoclostridium sp.]HPU45355.1 transketolase [Thermoclostridium sp.]